MAIVFGIVAVLVMTTAASAQDEPQVLVELSRDKIYEGETVAFRVLLNHIDEGVEPDLSEFRDFDVQLVGTQDVDSQQVISVNGRTQRIVRRGTLYEYKLLPKQTGTLTVPALTVKTVGQEYRSKALTLEVVPAEEQDVAFLEVTTRHDEVYPMQPFDVTLTVGVKPIPKPHADTDPLSVQDPPVQLSIPWADDEQLPDGLKADQPAERWLGRMLNRRSGFLINGKPANRDPFGFGGFGDSFFSGMVNERSEAFLPRKSRSLRKDRSGRRYQYFEYTLRRTLHAEKVGEFALGPITLKGVFGTRVDTRGQLEGEPVYAFAEPVTIRVKDVPSEGRPASYVGAVGVFDVGAELSPREAKVGDPMTLTLWLQGKGTLDRALAPKLNEVDAIADDFKVYEATEETRNDRRIFTYSIRPRHADVDELPPVAMSYFDFEEEEFVTLQTAPMAINVAEADRLSDDEIAVAAPAPRGGDGIEVRSEGIFANVTDLGELRDESVRPDQWFLSLGGLAGLFVVIVAIKERTQKLRSDSRFQRRRRAARDASQQLREGIEQLEAGRVRSGVELVSTSLIGLIADVSGSDKAGQTSAEAMETLKQWEVDATLIERSGDLLQKCDDARYAGVEAATDGLADQAQNTFDALVRALKSKRLAR